MTKRELIENNVFKVIHPGKDLDEQIGNPYCCDLLSIAMSSAPAGCVWCTVMANVNTLAVASLTEASCIVLAQGVTLDAPSMAKAAEQDITVLSTTLPIFDAALLVYQMEHGLGKI